MTDVFITVFLVTAVAWLCYRIAKVLTVPNAVLVQLLGLDSPPVPLVVVDYLGHDTASVRWTYGTAVRPPVGHAVKLCGRSVRISPSATKAVFRDLEPNSYYEVSIQAVDKQKRLGYPAMVKYHTLSSQDKRAPTGRLEQVEKRSQVPQRSDGPSGHMLVQVAATQRELESLRSQQQMETTEFCQDKTALVQQRQSLISLRRKEEQTRSQARSELAALEDTRHQLELRRTKLSKRHKELQEVFNKRHSRQDKWATEIQQWKSGYQKLEAEVQQLALQKAEQETALVSATSDVTEKAAILESRVKEEFEYFSSVERQREDLTLVISRVMKNADIATGIVTQEALDSLFTVSTSAKEHCQRLRYDLESDLDLEKNWSQLQSDMEKRYVIAYEQCEAAFRSLDTATADAQAHTKAQAQIYALQVAASTQASVASSYTSYSTRKSLPLSFTRGPVPSHGDSATTGDGVEELLNPGTGELFLPKNLLNDESGMVNKLGPAMESKLEPELSTPKPHIQQHPDMPRYSWPDLAMTEASWNNGSNNDVQESTKNIGGWPGSSASQKTSTLAHEAASSSSEVGEQSPSAASATQSPGDRRLWNKLHMPGRTASFVRRLSIFSKREREEPALDSSATAGAPGPLEDVSPPALLEPKIKSEYFLECDDDQSI